MDNDARPSPWYNAPEEVRIIEFVDPYTSLVANLTPKRTMIRIGVLINGKESSIVVPFDLAEQFLRSAVKLIQEKGVAP